MDALAAKGVDRLMLDRIGGEIARATSFVRFSPESVFPHHTHGGGEEIFVMDGVLEDEKGRYPTGTYIRDPIGSSHAPFSREGCTLFVKLWQFAKDDCERIVVDDASRVWRDAAEGFALQPLHKFGEEITYLVGSRPAGPSIDASIRAARRFLFLPALSTTSREHMPRIVGFAIQGDESRASFQKADARYL